MRRRETTARPRETPARALEGILLRERGPGLSSPGPAARVALAHRVPEAAERAPQAPLCPVCPETCASRPRRRPIPSPVSSWERPRNARRVSRGKSARFLHPPPQTCPDISSLNGSTSAFSAPAPEQISQKQRYVLDLHARFTEVHQGNKPLPPQESAMWSVVKKRPSEGQHPANLSGNHTVQPGLGEGSEGSQAWRHHYSLLQRLRPCPAQALPPDESTAAMVRSTPVTSWGLQSSWVTTSDGKGHAGTPDHCPSACHICCIHREYSGTGKGLWVMGSGVSLYG
ncbi:uncharacterized protein [Manis javanica]|uniref:uncharacterized protein n=1 Tax=Manis javanica TaxID=9974 RepID=UPI003C6D08B2